MIPQLNEREEHVLSLLVADASLSVADLAQRFSVSTVTMRGYLNALAEKGYLYRVRGGAVPAIHPEIVTRTNSMREEKHAIARAAAGLVRDGDTIMIEAGTTTSLVARYLLGRRDVQVVTNNALALAHARGNPGLHVSLIGGEYRPATESIVGPIAVSHVRMFHVGIAFVGTDGFSVAAGLSTQLVESAEIVRAMAGQATRVAVLADSSKFGHRGFAHVLPIDRVTMIVTDAGLSADARNELTEAGVDVIIATKEGV